MIVDRENNHVNFVFDDDLNYIWASVEDILGVDLPTEFSIEELKNTYGIGIDTFTNVLVNVLDALLSNMEKPTDTKEYAESTYRNLEQIRKALNDIAKVEDGTITINGKLPVNVGAYEFTIFGWSQYYESVDGSAILFIEPIRVVIDDESNSKVYGTDDPELTATVKYYGIAGRENVYGAYKDWEIEYDASKYGYSSENVDATINKIRAYAVSYTHLTLPTMAVV